MEITGRITVDAQVKTLQDKRQLVSFSIAINDNYRTKDGEFQASLNFHVNDIKFVSMTGSRQNTVEAIQAEELSDLPF